MDERSAFIILRVGISGFAMRISNDSFAVVGCAYFRGGALRDRIGTFGAVRFCGFADFFCSSADLLWRGAQQNPPSSRYPAVVSLVAENSRGIGSGKKGRTRQRW